MVNTLSFPLCPGSPTAGPATRLPSASQHQRSYQPVVSRDGPPCFPSPPRAAIRRERGEQWGKRWTWCLHHQHSWPFVLSDPGLLSRFQSGSNTSCGGKVQGDAVTGRVSGHAYSSGAVIRGYLCCNYCEVCVQLHSPLKSCNTHFVHSCLLLNNSDEVLEFFTVWLGQRFHLLSVGCMSATDLHFQHMIVLVLLQFPYI